MISYQLCDMVMLNCKARWNCSMLTYQKPGAFKLIMPFLIYKSGLCHPAACPLWDQAEETIDHLLVSCVFTRQIWFSFLQKVGLQTLAAQIKDPSFEDWWAGASRSVNGQVWKGLNSAIILGAWSLWNHSDRCLFDGVAPNLASIISVTREALQKWSISGARGVSYLLESSSLCHQPLSFGQVF